MTPEPQTPFGSKRSHALAALLLACFALVLLIDPIVRHATHSYTTANFAQAHTLTSWELEKYELDYHGMCDPPTQMQPWMRFSGEELRAGRVPLWNPYNGNGVPHLANYQSAVFSPFSVPFYVLSFKTALIVAAWMRLFALGFFTYLFLRTIRFEFLPSLLGATAFMLNGKSILLLAYPHSAVATALPAGLLCVERAARALESGASRRRVVAWLAGLCVAFVVGIYAGHPEPLAWVGSLTFLWTAWRAFGISRRLGFRAGAWLLVGFGSASVVAFMLGAPQILPFLEYWRHSVVLGTRVPLLQPSLTEWWPLLMYPSAVGSPVTRFMLSSGLPFPNFEQVNTSYPGAIVLLLALVGLFALRSDRRVRPFAIGVVAWLVLTCDVGGLGRLWDRTPGLGSTVLLARSQSVWLFGLAALAALALQKLIDIRPTRRTWMTALAILVGGGAAIAVCTWGASRLLEENIEKGYEGNRELVRASIEGERWILCATAAVALVFAAAMAVVANGRAKRVLACAILGLVVFQNGRMTHEFNPTIEDRFVFPRTPAIEALQSASGGANVLALTDNGLPPDTNLEYRVPMPTNYDALGVRRFEELKYVLFESFGPWLTPSHASPRSLALLGIEYVITAGDWVPSATGLSAYDVAKRAPFEPVMLNNNVSVEQTFVCDRPNLDEVTVFASTMQFGAVDSSDLRLRLYDEHDVLIAERLWSPEELRADTVRESDIAFAWQAFGPTGAFVAKFATLTFPPRADSAGARFRLVADSTRSAGNRSTLLWFSKAAPLKGAQLRISGAVRNGMLYFDWRGEPHVFEHAAQLGRLSLSKFTRGLGRFFAVAAGVECGSGAQAMLALSSAEFDPSRMVTIEKDVGDPTFRLLMSKYKSREARRTNPPPTLPAADREFEAAARAEVVSSNPTEIRLRVTRRDPGYLVACQTWYPGWKATVNGEERPVLVGNYAFQAVRLDAGSNDVVLRFDPDSWRIGLHVATAGLLIGVVAWFVAARKGAAA
ncbi:MAG: YfhO family protein [Planctomycetes bacterium]|nr:YfhO family protein [Planctomycetota bacterium]